MKIKSGVEQGICILIMLAIQKNHTPIKSYILSERLGVSDSYLKKIMRKLVVAKLITSDAGKNGGFVLNKSLSEMTMLEVFEAIEGNERFVPNTDLVEKVFTHTDIANEQKREALNIFHRAEDEYKKKLADYTLDNILPTDIDNYTSIDWAEIVTNN